MFRKSYLIILFLLIILTSACKGETNPQPTLDTGQMETEVAEQVAAQLTQIFLSQPTATNLPSSTVPVIPISSATDTSLQPTEATATTEPASPTPQPPTATNTEPTSTATLRPSPTPTPQPFACLMTKQVPDNGKTFKPDADFDVVWTVKNTGTALWDKNEVDYRYDSGDKFYQNDIYDLPKDVKPGESIDLIVDMKAPGEEGKFDTTWVLRRGNHLLCTLTVEINVKK